MSQQPPQLPQNPPSVLPYQTPGLTSTGALCPKCGCPQSKPVKFTWWGGLLGPKLFSHVKCLQCGAGFNSKTGRSNNTAIGTYIAVTGVIAIAAIGLYWMARFG